ncbi:unnamed protein product [Sphenostylis stenocarpa]|uniref:Uncharacterized protein n=1 Tax=Sphenostylis stenocarpa TaxID=92480 RepID=A0AA86VHP8_9FABA|nr:unnamed protein product [Sphenostylis stenocarpa]
MGVVRFLSLPPTTYLPSSTPVRPPLSNPHSPSSLLYFISREPTLLPPPLTSIPSALSLTYGQPHSHPSSDTRFFSLFFTNRGSHQRPPIRPTTITFILPHKNHLSSPALRTPSLRLFPLILSMPPAPCQSLLTSIAPPPLQPTPSTSPNRFRDHLHP